MVIDVETGYFVQKVQMRIGAISGCRFIIMVEARTGDKTLRREDRLPEEESGHAAGDNTKEAGVPVMATGM